MNKLKCFINIMYLEGLYLEVCRIIEFRRKAFEVFLKVPLPKSNKLDQCVLDYR